MRNHEAVAFFSGALVATVLLKITESWRQKMTKPPPSPGSGSVDWAHVSADPIKTEDLISKVASPTAGAIVTFGGVTRDNFNGRKVSRLE